MRDYIGKRKIYFLISALIILAGLLAALFNGFQWDIQFEGGTIIKVEMPNDGFDANKIEARLRETLGKNVTAQKTKTFDPDNQAESISMLTLKVTKNEALNDTEMNLTYELLNKEFGVSENAESQVQSVEPFIGAELKNKALQAIFISIVLIILYVWLRYSKINGLAAAIFAIVALLHDVLVVVGVYAIFKIPINESFVAAVLTILGYSINDTIVIYDRIRENSTAKYRGDLKTLANKSLGQSMTRAINTSVTTIVSILVVYVFAAINNIASLKEFTFPLMIGLVSGTYSSLFIATPLWYIWQKKTAYKAAKG